MLIFCPQQICLPEKIKNSIQSSVRFSSEVLLVTLLILSCRHSCCMGTLFQLCAFVFLTSVLISSSYLSLQLSTFLTANVLQSLNFSLSFLYLFLKFAQSILFFLLLCTYFYLHVELTILFFPLLCTYFYLHVELTNLVPHHKSPVLSLLYVLFSTDEYIAQEKSFCTYIHVKSTKPRHIRFEEWLKTAYDGMTKSSSFFFLSPTSFYLTSLGVEGYSFTWSHTTTVGRTPLDEGWPVAETSTWQTHNTHNKHHAPRRDSNPRS